MIATTDKPKLGFRARLKPGISNDIEELAKNKRLSPAELDDIARRMCETPSVEEASRLSDEYMMGFYGTK